MNQETGKLHEDFLKTFYKLVYLAKIHQVNNPLLMECIVDFKKVAGRLLVDDDHISLQVSRGNIFIGDEKLLHRREIGKLVNNMLQYFEKRDLQGLCFYAAVQEASDKEIIDFGRILNESEQQKDPLNWFVEQMEDQGFIWVENIHEQDTQLTEQGSGTEPLDQEQLRKAKAKESYFYALDSIKEVAEKITSQKKAGVRKALRVIQNMVDLVMEDESIVLGISTIRDYDDYTFTHSINVAILSMCLGRRIGVSRTSLNRLGICGLFHDLGKLDIPVEIIRLPRKLSKSEFDVVKKHTIYSVAQIIKLQAARGLKSKILLPPFEHHMKYDLSGYPQTPQRKPVSLFGRILTITDVFDAITSPRSYRFTALTQDQALGYMLSRSGTDFDPILLKAFINMLGIYPIGSLLELDTGELALVMHNGNATDGTRPRVMLLAADGNGDYSKAGVVDLDERDVQSGAFRRNIVKSLHPSANGIQPAEFLI
ncbi:MAG: HD domain-containing protein [Desulfobacteraceae bacterium]|nr:HD domain-containing protein [Desulfobacteraceae bacterium]